MEILIVQTKLQIFFQSLLLFFGDFWILIGGQA